MRNELNHGIQTSFHDHANHREESFANAQNEPFIAEAGLRSCLCILPHREYTPGLSSAAYNTRLAQVHIVTAH
jgi:hypothetical protein